MTKSSTPSMDKQSRDAAYWAPPVSTMKVGRMPTGALNLNVDGRQTMSPLQGFGQLWQKTWLSDRFGGGNWCDRIQVV